MKIILVLFLSSFPLSDTFGISNFKDIEIHGLKIYTEKSLLQNTKIDNLPIGKDQYESASNKIAAFYQKNGFYLIKTYLVQETDDRLNIYIDEGLIGRIVFLGLNSIDTIRMKYDFDLRYRIFNKYTVEKELTRLKKKYKFLDIKYSLIPAAEGDKAFFQINEEIIIPGIGATRLPFFKEYSSRYNLEIKFIRQNRDKSKGIIYSLKTSYSKGLIPEAEYHYPAFIKKNDLLTIGSSIGLYYGLDLKFKNPPKWTFMEVHSNYYFAPLLKDFFTPMASVSAYYSRASRPDIGLLSYNYLKFKSILAPGITLLKKLRFYTGLGCERVFIFTPEIDTEGNYIADIEKHNDTWAILESRMKIDLRPWTLKNTRKQEFETIYNYYTNKRSFYELNSKWAGDMEFKNLDLYLFVIEYERVWRRPPFYHEYSVSDANFKGFLGKSYYTRNIIRLSNEYRASIYRDSYHIGIFTDIVRFEGSGYDLTGNQHGIVAGIAGHIIFLDQFEFNIFFGKDYLFSKQESQYNIYMNANKKW